MKRQKTGKHSTGGLALALSMMSSPAGAAQPVNDDETAAALQLIDAPYSRTYDSGTGTSPLSLLTAPRDAVGYYEAKLRARSLISGKQFAVAEPLVEFLAREYPRDPENWALLANVKQALKKHREAALAHARGGQLRGWDLGSGHGLDMASNYLAAGDRQAAMKVLRRLISFRHFYWRTALYEYEEFAALRDDPEFSQMTGQVDTSDWDRVQGWNYDLDFLIEEIKRVNPDYRDKPLPREMLRRHKALKAAIHRLSDEEIYFGMLQVLAVMDQGHTFLSPSEKTSNRFLPLRLYAFPEGLFVIDAVPEHRDLIGTKVLKIGSMPAETALRSMGDAMGMDGEMGRVHLASWLVFTHNLKGMGAIDRVDKVAFTVERPRGGTRTVSLTTMATAHNGRPDVLTPPASVPAPMFLRDMQKTHFVQPLPEHHALYLRLNAIRPEEDQTLDQLADRIGAKLIGAGPSNLILDLRHNNGGTTQLYPKLLVMLSSFGRTPGKRLYVLIGRRTYSAAGNLITDLERLATPIFVGEPSGECCNLYGDPVRIRLPYSKIQGELTAVKWQLSEPGDRRREIAPAIPVQLTAEAYFAGKDPALEAIYQLITKLPRT